MEYYDVNEEGRPFDFVGFDWNGTLEPTYDDTREIALTKGLGSSELATRFQSFFKSEKRRLKRESLLDKGVATYNRKELLESCFVEISKCRLVRAKLTSAVKEQIVRNYTCKELFPGALETIHEISIELGVPVGIVRNADGDAHTFWKADLIPTGASRYFDARSNVVLSGDVGVKKPHPKIFLALLKKVDLLHLHATAPHRILFLGNETETDIKGANGLGWKTVLIKNTEKTSNGLADWEIDHLEELLPIVRGNE